MLNQGERKHPLLEVFGFPAWNQSEAAQRHRRLRLCPFHNRVPNCTKDKANDPLGVCSIANSDGSNAIVCPVRFRQDWLIAENAAAFFFPDNARWTSLSEVRLNDQFGRSAGNIDMTLVSYDQHGKLLDFGSVEMQGVYISGNIRRPFEHYMERPANRANMDWSREPNYPRADYLSSSRKRLVPQLIYKGRILKAWGKKQAVVLHESFFDTLPSLENISPEKAEMAWLIYGLDENETAGQLQLTLRHTVFTEFQSALDQITLPTPGPIEQFVRVLQDKLDQALDGEQNPPDAPTLTDVFRGE